VSLIHFVCVPDQLLNHFALPVFQRAGTAVALVENLPERLSEPGPRCDSTHISGKFNTDNDQTATQFLIFESIWRSVPAAYRTCARLTYS